MSIEWSTIKHEFTWDGSLRDICVLSTSAEDWTALLRALPSAPFLSTFRVRDVTCPIPDASTQVFEGSLGGAELAIDSGGVTFSCHFFTVDQIEFDLDPQQVVDQKCLDSLLAFMQFVGNCIDKNVYLTPENLPASPIIRYDPDSEGWQYLPCQT